MPHAADAKKIVNPSTIVSYSETGSKHYEDPMNKNFLYGEITVRFIEQVPLRDQDKVILDIGCGTGFIFDELYHAFHERGIKGIGIEPAEGMLAQAKEKYAGDELYSFSDGSFEALPLDDRAVDHIVSTLALHWVKALKVAADEMRRVLKDDGSLDILMIAKDDGAHFKKAIVNALRKHLTFRQIMATATLVQRARPDQVIEAFSVFHDGFEVNVQEFRDIVYGSFDDHMKWWTARSSPVIADVEDKDRFMVDLREELEKIADDKGIPFDTAYYYITARSK